jgi:hypothetical protein
MKPDTRTSRTLTRQCLASKPDKGGVLLRKPLLSGCHVRGPVSGAPEAIRAVFHAPGSEGPTRVTGAPFRSRVPDPVDRFGGDQKTIARFHLIEWVYILRSISVHGHGDGVLYVKHI